MKFDLKIFLATLVFLGITSLSQAALQIDRGPIYGLLKKALPFKNLEIAYTRKK